MQHVQAVREAKSNEHGTWTVTFKDGSSLTLWRDQFTNDHVVMKFTQGIEQELGAPLALAVVSTLDQKLMWHEMDQTFRDFQAISGHDLSEAEFSVHTLDAVTFGAVPPEGGPSPVSVLVISEEPLSPNEAKKIAEEQFEKEIAGAEDASGS